MTIGVTNIVISLKIDVVSYSIPTSWFDNKWVKNIPPGVRIHASGCIIKTYSTNLGKLSILFNRM